MVTYNIYNLAITDENLKLLDAVVEEAASKETEEYGPIRMLSELLKATAEENKHKRKVNPRHDEYRKAAWKRYDNKDFEIDEEAEVNTGPLGAYVQGWFWVPKEDLKE